MIKALMSLWVSFVMLFVSFVPGYVAPENKNTTGKTYPYIFVHGFLGWGEDEGIDDDLPYWGATSCHLISNLREEGYECYDASVGPLSSCWDRACELYAQLTGTRVDYGAAHSAKCNHLRYGRTYDEPLIENWGELDENGLMNKVNLIGHSFGGNTIRQLAALLADGSAEEIAATDPDDISPLFTGGKSDYVNTVVAICSPNNGSTMKYVLNNLKLIEPALILMYTYVGVMGRSFANGYVDFHLEQFGLSEVPGEGDANQTIIKSIKTIMQQEYDNIAYDLSPDGAQALNEKVDLEDNIYYFSYPFRTTFTVPILNTEFPLPSTLAVLQLTAMAEGVYSVNLDTSYKIDKNWLANDGLVNVISAKYPLGDAHKDYDPDNIETGIWNVMPLSRGDHGSAIGIGTDEESVMEFYNGIISMIEALPVTS